MAAAEGFRKVLEDAGDSMPGMERPNTFYEFVRSLMDAVIMPFSVSEIIWSPGGAKIEGFQEIESHHFTFRNSMTPLLITDDCPEGMPLDPNRFVVHQFRRKADPVRGGLIRVLAWLHCLQNWPLKDLFSFIERFGMPFVVAKVSKDTWDQERNTLKNMIRNFGPDGGGVFSAGTEIQLLNAANTGGDNVYFHALEYCHDAIYTLLVGQLASSGESSGLSGGDAQSKVRQDIIVSDARAIESTVRSQIAIPWTRWNYGEGVPTPRLHFKIEPAEDLAQLSTVVANLSNAGYKADEEELSTKFGLKLRYEPPAQQNMGMPMTAAPLSGEKPQVKKEKQHDDPELNDAMKQWLGPLADELKKITDDADLSDEEFARRLKACADGEKSGSTEKFEQYLEGQIYEGFVHGVTGK